MPCSSQARASASHCSQVTPSCPSIIRLTCICASASRRATAARVHGTLDERLAAERAGAERLAEPLDVRPERAVVPETRDDRPHGRVEGAGAGAERAALRPEIDGLGGDDELDGGDR